MMPGNDERGAALVLALFALAVIGALVGSNFLAGRVEQQSGQNTFFAVQAREAAEAGLNDAMASTDAAALAALAVGDAPLNLGSISLNGGVSARREATRLTSGLFLIRSRGVRQSTGGIVLGVRSLGALVQLPDPSASSDTAAGSAGSGLRVVERGWIQLY
jgi:hypothetical protein